MYIWQWLLALYLVGLLPAFCTASYFTGRKDKWRNEFENNISRAYFWPLVVLFMSVSWVTPVAEKVYFYFRSKGLKHRELAEKRRKTSGAEQQGGRPAENGRNRPF